MRQPQSKRPMLRAADVAANARRIEILGTATIRAAAAEGANPRFDMVVNTGGPMNIGWFDAPVIVDLATLDLSVQRVPALYDHCPDSDYVVGQTDSLTLDSGVMRAAGEVIVDETVPMERNRAAQVRNKAKKGYVWQTSIGADPTSVERIEPGKSVTVNGRNFTGPVYIARGCVTREVSFVVLGGDRHTSAVVARRKIKGSAMPTFEEWLASQGLDQSALSEQALAALKITYNQLYPAESETPPTNAEAETPPTEEEPPPTNAAAETPPTEEEPPATNAAARRPGLQANGRPAQRPDAVADENRRIAANRTRIARIDQICAGAGNPEITATDSRRRSVRVSLNAHAVANNWSVERTELEALRASRGTGPGLISRSHDRDCTVDALACAAILRAGGRLDHPAYTTPRAIAMRLPAFLRAGINAEVRQRAMEAGHRYSQMTALELARESLRLDGRDAPHDRTDMVRAAFSGGSLTNVFTTNINAILLATYVEAEDTTAGWVREQEVNDFRLNERPRKNIGSGMKKLPKGGTADHRNRSDTGESYKIARYASQIVIDEQDFINDNLGALADEPVDMGNEAARLRPDLVYAIMLANNVLTSTGRALFNTTEGNRITGAAFAAATLRAAVAKMRLIRENNVNLNLKPTHLMVPPTLVHLAYELVNSSEIIIAGTAGSVTERGSANSLVMDNLSIVSDGRLENGVLDPDTETLLSGSASNWYLASAIAHTIEVGYLKGTGRAPQVRPFQLDKGQWGMGWDCKMDIGAKALDWKGLQRNEQ